jgi:DNA-binding CsgD family transcriptional regulator
VDPEIEAVRELEDPLKQAQQASELLTRYQAAVTQLSRVRREAIEQLIAQGMTKAQLAEHLGMTRARVGQLLAAGPRSEGLFLGNGKLTVALGAKLRPTSPSPARSSPRRASRPTSGSASWPAPSDSTPTTRSSHRPAWST